MTHRKFVCSDHHLGHANIIKFKNNEGNPMRDFASIKDHDETIIDRHNAIVRPIDRVYFLGDVAINRTALKMISRMNGIKVLIKGNHDIFKLKDYIPYFTDIRACKVMPDQCIMTHIPIHPESLGRFKLNIHGHLHANNVADKRYRNVSMEQINYTPVDLEEILG